MSVSRPLALALVATAANHHFATSRAQTSHVQRSPKSLILMHMLEVRRQLRALHTRRRSSRARPNAAFIATAHLRDVSVEVVHTLEKREAV